TITVDIRAADDLQADRDGHVVVVPGRRVDSRLAVLLRLPGAEKLWQGIGTGKALQRDVAPIQGGGVHFGDVRVARNAPYKRFPMRRRVAIAQCLPVDVDGVPADLSGGRLRLHLKYRAVV